MIWAFCFRVLTSVRMFLFCRAAMSKSDTSHFDQVQRPTNPIRCSGLLQANAWWNQGVVRVQHLARLRGVLIRRRVETCVCECSLCACLLC